MSKYATKVTNKAVKSALVAHARANGIHIHSLYEHPSRYDYAVYDDEDRSLYGSPIMLGPKIYTEVTVDEMFTLLEKKKEWVYILSEGDVALHYNPDTEVITLSDAYDERRSVQVDMSELTRVLQGIQGEL